MRWRDEAVARDRLFDGQDGGERLIDDLDQPCGRPRLIECGRGDGRNRLAFVFDDVGGQCRLVTADRGDVVLAGNVGSRDRGDDAGRGERARQIDAADTGMRMGAQDQRRFQRPRHGRDIVEIARGTGDMPDRAVVARRRVYPSADPCERLVHSASTRTSTFEEVSNWKRRKSPAAARRR